MAFVQGNADSSIEKANQERDGRDQEDGTTSANPVRSAGGIKVEGNLFGDRGITPDEQTQKDETEQESRCHHDQGQTILDEPMLAIGGFGDGRFQVAGRAQSLAFAQGGCKTIAVLRRDEKGCVGCFQRQALLR